MRFDIVRTLVVALLLAGAAACGSGEGITGTRRPSAGGSWSARTTDGILLITLREYDDHSVTGTGYVVWTSDLHTSYLEVGGSHAQHPSINLRIVVDGVPRPLEFAGTFTSDTTMVGVIGSENPVTFRRRNREVPAG